MFAFISLQQCWEVPHQLFVVGEDAGDWVIVVPEDRLQYHNAVKVTQEM